jgi:autotransporter-associated beta strand protein
MVKIYGKSQIFAKAFFVPIPITSVPQLPTNIIWTGLGSDNNWSTSSNWNLRVPQDYDTLKFAGSTRLIPLNNLTNDMPFRGIFFNPGSGAFRLDGNRFVLYSNSIVNSSNNIQTINNNINLGLNAETVNCATSSINLNCNISGSGSLTKVGRSLLTLSGNNTYTGNTYISSGIVSILNSNPFGTGKVYLSGSVAGISVNSNASPTNVIINNPIFIDGVRQSFGYNIQAQKNTILNGLITVGPRPFLPSGLEVGTNSTMTINGGITAFYSMNTPLRFTGTTNNVNTGTFVISSKPIIMDNPNGGITTSPNFPVENIILAVTGNKCDWIIVNTTFTTLLPYAINNDIITFATKSRIDLNGNHQKIRPTFNIAHQFNILTSCNIYNNKSNFVDLNINCELPSAINYSYTGSISGNVNLHKNGTGMFRVSGIYGITPQNIGLRYTGFTAISAGTILNYITYSNPSNKINYSRFTATSLTVDFAIPPIAGDSFILLGGRTVNSYPSVTLQNASGRTGSYNSTTSTLSIT